MNYQELSNYIQDLKKSGFDVIRLTVALHKKISFPVVSLIMCMIAIPFSFSTGKRGSLYGIGVSILIGIVFWLTLEFFEQVGNAGKLVPFLAAWAPNLIFGAGGIYSLFTIRT
jgi:lipopolysaccharide export LptBFGC system permease protein LptF